MQYIRELCTMYHRASANRTPWSSFDDGKGTTSTTTSSLETSSSGASTSRATAIHSHGKPITPGQLHSHSDIGSRCTHRSDCRWHRWRTCLSDLDWVMPCIAFAKAGTCNSAEYRWHVWQQTCYAFCYFTSCIPIYLKPSTA